MANHQHLTTITQHPSLAVTLCDICMPKAFCGLEMCTKKLSELCALCERKTFTKYVNSLIGVTSHITPLPAGEGLGEGSPPHGLETCAKRLSELCALCERKNLYEVCKQPNRGNLTYHAPPCGGGVGGGATSSWARNCAPKGSVNSVGSVREKTHQRAKTCDKKVLLNMRSQ